MGHYKSSFITANSFQQNFQFWFYYAYVTGWREDERNGGEKKNHSPPPENNTPYTNVQNQ